jgi:hypothetical protein
MRHLLQVSESNAQKSAADLGNTPIFVHSDQADQISQVEVDEHIHLQHAIAIAAVKTDWLGGGVCHAAHRAFLGWILST